MVIGDIIVYEISLLPMGIILTLLAAPLLLFIGFYFARVFDKRRALEDIELTDADGDVELEYDEEQGVTRKSTITVTPHDLFWHKYTTDKAVMRDISNAVLLFRRETRNYEDTKIFYPQFQQHLKEEKSHSIAKTVQTFHIYNDDELRAHLEQYEQVSM